MKIEMIHVYQHLDTFLEKAQEHPSQLDELWQEYAIQPYWSSLCRYAPMDLSMRQPAPIHSVERLKRQVERLRQLNLEKLQGEFERIAQALPNFDDDPIQVALYPLEDESNKVREKQNGVIGTSLFGNLMLQIDPFANDFKPWIAYVFAHEYHHTVWGNYWYVLHGGKLGNTFLDALVIDGEADGFALSLYPQLKPQWLFSMEEQEIQSLWESCYAALCRRKDVDYSRYMFGSQEQGIPWSRQTHECVLQTDTAMERFFLHMDDHLKIFLCIHTNFEALCF